MAFGRDAMTSYRQDAGRNQLESHAALPLHTRAPMRLTLACAALLACALTSGTAFAQTGTGSSGTGTCSGLITGNIGLSVNQGGSLQTIQAASLGYVYGNAECECAYPLSDQDNNILLNIKLTQALPIGSTGTV